MDDKSSKKKHFWKINKRKDSLEEKKESVSTLRSIFLDDTALKRGSGSRDQAALDSVPRRGGKPVRECQSICVPPANEQTFFNQVQVAGMPTSSKGNEIYLLLILAK